MPGFYVHNFGCRATQADGNTIEQQLLERGFFRSDMETADVVILNTCTVTAAADQDARAAIRRIHRLHPETRILVTGCYAQRAPQEVVALPGVTWIVDNSYKHEVAGTVANFFARNEAPASLAKPRDFVALQEVGVVEDAPSAHSASLLIGDIFAHTELLAAPVFDSAGTGKTRPNLKVQDGCNNRCSFCVIPYTRGSSRSLKLESVLDEVRTLVRAGYREVVISGINLGRWGRDLTPPQRFEDLIRAILEQTELEKLRISSVEPMDWSDELIELWAGSPRIARHAHVPLQSGSDRILRAMHRRYRPWHYEEKLRKMRTSAPDAALGADVMVGFPGETDELFEENREFIERSPLTYLHVFTFSARPGTPAASLPDQVPVRVARERNRVLRELIAEKNRKFRAGFVGCEIDAIMLAEDTEDGFTSALTDNFLKLRLVGRFEPNQWMSVRVREVDDAGLIGTVSDRAAAF